MQIHWTGFSGHTRRSAPARVLNLVAVVTLRFNGSTAPTATSGVSTTDKSLGGAVIIEVGSVSANPLTLLGLIPSLEAADARGDAAVRLGVVAPRDFLEVRGERMDVAVEGLPATEWRRLLEVGDGVISVVGVRFSDFLSFPFLFSSHSKCKITFLVAHWEDCSVTRYGELRTNSRSSVCPSQRTTFIDDPVSQC